MGERETVTGTLHVVRRPYRSRHFMDNLIADMMVEKGLAKHRCYPPMLYVTNDETYDGEHPFIWKFRGAPKALAEAEDGTEVTVTATIDRWKNGIGAYLSRPKIMKAVNG